jgi:hypothetical protein
MTAKDCTSKLLEQEPNETKKSMTNTSLKENIMNTRQSIAAWCVGAAAFAVAGVAAAAAADKPNILVIWRCPTNR